jgi:hypothetical protein
VKVAEVADDAEVGSLAADDGQKGEIALTGGDPASGEDADAVAIGLECPINSGRYNPKTPDLRVIAGYRDPTSTFPSALLASVG